MSRLHPSKDPLCSEVEGEWWASQAEVAVTKERYLLLPMACIPCSVLPGVRKTTWKATRRSSSFARLFLVLQGSSTVASDAP